MDNCCDVCDKMIEIKTKSKYLQSLTHNAVAKCIPTKHNIENPVLFDKDAIFNKYITNHNEKKLN